MSSKAIKINSRMLEQNLKQKLQILKFLSFVVSGLKPVPTLLLTIIFLGIIGLGLSNRVEAASFSFSPSNGVFKTECVQSVDIIINAEGQSTNAAEATIFFNPGQVTVVDSLPDTPGIQVNPGGAFYGYFINEADNSTGVIRLVGASIDYNLTSSARFATIEFISSAPSTSFSIEFSGAGVTTDSNIADSQSGNDILTSVGSGSYIFETGFCDSDNEPPVITFTNPSFTSNTNSTNSVNNTDATNTTGTVDNKLDSRETISFTLSDDISGVDLDSLEILIDDLTFNINSPEVQYVLNDGIYSVTVDPGLEFDEDISGNIVVIVYDNVGNRAIEQRVYNADISGAPLPGSGTDDIEDEDETGGGLPSIADNPIVSAITNILTDEKFFHGTPLEGIASRIGNSGVLAASSGILLLIISIIPALNVVATPTTALGILSLLLLRKRRVPMGLVVDGLTGKPIQFASCSIYSSGTEFRISETVSDTEGRYGFILTEGNYRLEVKKSGYSNYIAEIKISQDKASLVHDAKLIPESLMAGKKISKYSILKLQLKNILGVFIKLMFIIGIFLSIISVMTIPVVLNYLILGFYIIVLAIYSVSKIPRGSKTSAVLNSVTNFRVPYANIKIFKLDSGELVDTKVTDSNGYFDYYGEAGEYAVLVSVPGYRFPSRFAKETIQKGIYGTLMKVRLKQGSNEMNIYVDPLIGSGNLENPFSK